MLEFVSIFIVESKYLTNFYAVHRSVMKPFSQFQQSEEIISIVTIDYSTHLHIQRPYRDWLYRKPVQLVQLQRISSL